MTKEEVLKKYKRGWYRKGRVMRFATALELVGNGD